MKKLIVILFILVNILLFFNIKQVYMDNDLTDVLQTINVHPDIVHASLFISNPNNELISDEDSEEILSMFRAITQQYDVFINYSEISFDKNEYVIYLMSETPIDQLLGLVTDMSLVFQDNSDYFYTNRDNIENGIYFFLLNNLIDVRILPISSMETIRGGMYTFAAYTQSDLEESVSTFLAEFDSYVDYFIEFDIEPFDIEYEIGSFFFPIVFVTMILISLVIIMYVHIHSKKIAMLKTMGFSIFALVKQLLLPLLILIFFSVSGINAILFILYVREINVRTIPIIWTLAQSGAIQLVGIVLTFALSIMLLLFIPSFSLLNNSNINRYLMNANYVLKIVVLVIMMPLLSSRIDSIQDNFKMLRYVSGYEKNSFIIEYQFSPMLSPMFRSDGYSTVFSEIVRNTDWENIGLEIIYEHDILYEYQRAYRVLNDAGGIYCRGGRMWSGEPLLNVNENYLDIHPVTDLYGNLVDLNQFDADVVYFIPEIYMGRDFIELWIDHGYKIIFVNNEQYLYDYSLDWSFSASDIPSQPYIVTVFKNTAFRLDASPFQNVFFNGDINNRLYDTHFYDRILVSTVGDELIRIREKHLQDLLNHIFVIIPTFGLVLVIIVQYSYLYLKSYKKRIYIGKLMGYNLFRVFSQLLLESSLAIVVAMSIVWYFQLDIRLLIGVLLLEIFVYLAVVATSRWNQSIAHEYNS